MKGQNNIFDRYGERPYTINYSIWDKDEKKYRTQQCVAGIHWYNGMLCGHITKNKTIAGWWCWDRSRYQKPSLYFGKEKKMGYCPSLKHAIMHMAETYQKETELQEFLAAD